MKKLVLIISIAIMAISNMQAQDTLYINQKVGGLLKVAVSNIDSLTFYKPTVSGVTNQLTVSDIDGNVYNIVTIGGQAWMKENLKVTKLNDGTNIPLVTTTVQWSGLTTSGYCFYNNSVTGGVYGALYNWYTVNTNKLCPTGWHVPSDAEWNTLTTILGGASVAGGKLKSTSTAYWNSPNTGADNSSGFTALPGGYRGSNGTFINIGYDCLWWSSTEYNASNAGLLNLSYNIANVYTGGNGAKQIGFSIRCLRD